MGIHVSVSMCVCVCTLIITTYKGIKENMLVMNEGIGNLNREIETITGLKELKREKYLN